MSVPAPDEGTRWRCAVCGNLTRFDVTRSRRTREYLHVTLGGEARVEQTEVLTDRVEQVRCRWCGGTDSVRLVDRPG